MCNKDISAGMVSALIPARAQQRTSPCPKPCILRRQTPATAQFLFGMFCALQSSVIPSKSASTRTHGVGVASTITAGNLYQLCLEAKPTFSSQWFSIADTATRLCLAIFAFYRFLLTQPLSLLRFAYGWNTLWCVAQLLTARHAS